MKKLLFIFVLYFGLAPYVSSAAPTLDTAQREVDRLRTVAAEKFEAANDATIRIRSLERETAALEQREAALQKELQAANRALAQLAIAQYKSSGFG